MDEVGTTVVAYLEDTYPQWKESDNFPSDHEALYDELFNLAKLDTASGWARMMIASLVNEDMKKETIDEQSIDTATALRDFIRDDPNVGFFGMIDFAGRYPEFGQAMGNIQYELKKYSE